MRHNETELNGLTLGNKYVIKSLIEDRGGMAVFETEHDGAPARVHLVEDGSAEAEWRQQQWAAAKDLSHPHILKVLAGGYAELNDTPYLYCVTEQPDDSLEGVLQDRPLSAEETTEILRAIVPALRHLHDGGWLHGAVEPASIVAVGDQVKLTIDTLTPGDSDALYQAESMALGSAIAKMLKADPEVDDVPMPLREMARGLIAGEWKLVDADRVLKGRHETPATAPAASPMPLASADGSKWKMAAAVGVGAVLLAIPFLFKSGPEKAAPAPAPAVNVPITTTTPPPGRERIVDRAASREPAASRELASSRPSAFDKSEGDWAVVAAIYRDRNAAVRRAAELSKRWTRSTLEVVPPAGEGSRYMVIAGRGMSKKDAERMRTQARSSGLPRDTYVTRLRQ